MKQFVTLVLAALLVLSGASATVAEEGATGQQASVEMQDAGKAKKKSKKKRKRSKRAKKQEASVDSSRQ